MTNTQVVRYRTADSAADANQKAIAKVFAQLRERCPEDLSYRVYRHGTEFIHIVATDGDPLAQLPAFHDFLTGLRTRLAVEPELDAVDVVGCYSSHDAEDR